MKVVGRTFITCLVFVLSICFAARAANAKSVSQWAVQELTFRASGQYANAYTQVSLTATFTGPRNVRQVVQGFWDGDNTFKVRWTPTAPGTWNYVSASTDAGLNGKTGRVECIAPLAGRRGFLRRDADHPHSFVFDDGARFFMWGQTYYRLLQNAMIGDTWKVAVVNSQARGMNKVRLYVKPAEIPLSFSKINYPTTSPFVGNDHAQLNLAHWRKLDEVVRYLEAQGVLAELIFFSKFKGDFGTAEQDERYLRHIIARYAAFPNVIWCLANEWNYTEKPQAYWNVMGRIIKREDPWSIQATGGALVRALSIHQQTRHDFQFFDEAWPSHAVVQLGVRNQGRAFRDGDEWEANNAAEEGRNFRNGDEWGNFSITYNWSRRMPVVNDEYGYVGAPDRSVPKDAKGQWPPLTREKHRHAMWGIAIAGGYGSAADSTKYDDGTPAITANWHDLAEYGDIKRLVDFYTTKGIEYWKLAGANALVKSGARVYAAAEAGRHYVIYSAGAASGGACALDLAKGVYTARRYNPRTGEDIALREVEGGGVRTFNLPDSDDWVVYLRLKRVAGSSSPKPN